ncbi:hypothetical protein PGH12_01405 [Chryseobacterium wangxinyae]|uniref:hypothetical protein n=1 Tax=Chryseobacterium sp. CY350 TaxID=2997336 RepID=UPI00226FF8BF|nr:hypothetical protein [Chryseobacterium sp. CY350]MCY0977162.1 hypothetical protein [Chryseobacterium sp. CY350]WBZ95817.1 hypothetical protein PGH12_01405 [Chryseobacterium sp. CY350]
MQKYFFVLISLALISCSTEDRLDDFSSAETIYVKDSFSDTTISKDLQAKRSPLSEKIYRSKEEMINDYTQTFKRAPTLHGPFTYSIRKPAYSTRPGGNQPFTETIFYNTQYSYPSIGTYVAEIYNYKIQILLPNDAVTGYVESLDVYGYSNYTTQAVGMNQYTSVGTPASGGFGGTTTGLYLNANTYGVILKYNSVGQLINYPIGITDTKTFTYFYVTP